MKARLCSVFFFLLIMFAGVLVKSHPVFASTEITTDIVSDTVWDTSGSPYIVSGQVNIATSTTLTILPGVVVFFDYGGELDVSGKLVANAMGDDKIYFTSINDTNPSGNQAYDVGQDDDFLIPPAVGDYEGIVFGIGASGDIENSEIRYAQTGIEGGMFAEGTSLTASDNTFIDDYIPMRINFGNHFIHQNNTFTDNTNNYIYMYGLGYVQDSNGLYEWQDIHFSFDSVPYYLENELQIAFNHTLTIQPGVTLMGEETQDAIYGFFGSSIEAIGTADNRITFDGIALAVSGSSKIDIAYADIKNIHEREVFTIHDHSNLSASNLSVSANNFMISNLDSTGEIDNSTVGRILGEASIENSEGIDLSDGSSLTVKNTSLDNFEDAVYMDTNSSVNFDGLSIDTTQDGIFMEDHATFTGKDLVINNCSDACILSANLDMDADNVPFQNNTITFDHGKISNGNYGMEIYNDTDVTVSKSSIANNTFGVYVNDHTYTQDTGDNSSVTYPGGNNTVNMASNWWGDISGPYNANSNSGGAGNEISDLVAATPWLVRDPTIPQKTPVLIVPGVLGTEISQPQADGSNEKLWLDLLHNFTDIGDDFMDPMQFNDDLTPIDTSLVLGDIIRRISIQSDVFKLTFFDYAYTLLGDFQRQGYTENADIFVFPYDWRYGVNDTNVAQLKEKVNDIMQETGSDSVDVIAHSTGGLLVKKYVMDNQTDNHLDKVVFVGVPNIGAPKALKVLLQGDDFDILFLADSEVKKIAKNFPVIYDLLPTLEYYKNTGSFIRIVQSHLFSVGSLNLDFAQIFDFLKSHSLNTDVWKDAQNLHTSEFDTYDMRSAGVDVYAIDGCKAGTIGQISEINSDIFPSYYKLDEVPGDGTVPFSSSSYLPISGANKYYALKADHASMLSQDGIRQQIVHIISGSSDTINPSLITQDVTQCGLNGNLISIFSPLSIDVTDQDNNHAGLSTDGVSIENTIPNADYEIMGDHKFVYLPADSGQTYTIKVAGTGSGVFTLTDADIVNDQNQNLQVFSQIPVTSNLKGTVVLGATTTLELDTDGDGVVDKTLQPSSVLEGEAATDFIPQESDQGGLNSQVIQSVREQRSNAAIHSNAVSVSSITAIGEKIVESLPVPVISNTISTNSKIRYTSYDTKNISESIAANKPASSHDQKINNVDSLSAVSEKSDVNSNRSVVLLSFAGILLLGFIARRFNK